MVSTVALFATALAAVVSALPCDKTAPTLPSAGNPASDLPLPPSGMTVKKIAVGHGIQNYTCASADATGAVPSNGALAVLYDVTSLYPGTAGTGLDPATWNNLPAKVLFGQDIPINLVNSDAAKPGTPDAPNALPEKEYLADTANPFPAASDLQLQGLPNIPFLGHHYFATGSVPTFDLSAAGLRGVVGKVNSTNAPADANKGVIGTGAVAWLKLDDTGASQGVKLVYRVVTAGGVAQACAVSGAGPVSVPYTAFYWFWGA